jgi:hypothetical protein
MQILHASAATPVRLAPWLYLYCPSWFLTRIGTCIALTILRHTISTGIDFGDFECSQLYGASLP